MFALPEESHAVVGYQIRIIVPAVVKAVLYLFAVHVDAVVVVAGVHYKATPFPPSWRYVRAVVFVQILAEVSCPISRVAQVSGEGVRLVISLPLGTAAVVVVCEDLMIVNVTTSEQRAPARTAHGSGHVRVSQLGALVPYSLQSPWHEVQRTQFNILIIRQNQHDVGLPLPGLLVREIGRVRLMIVIIIAVVIRLVEGAATLLTGVRVIRRSVSVGPSGIDTQQKEGQKLK